MVICLEAVHSRYALDSQARFLGMLREHSHLNKRNVATAQHQPQEPLLLRVRNGKEREPLQHWTDCKKFF